MTNQIGYVRVSTPDQDAQRQKNTIERSFDIDEWHADVEHGDTFTGRSGLTDLMDRLDEIGTVVVDEATRLGRTLQVREKVNTMRDHGVTVEIVDGGFSIPPNDEDMDMATGIWWDVTTRFAEEELRQIRRRTREGIRLAQEQGKHVGQVPRGYTTNDDGYLTVTDGTNQEYERCNTFIRLVNEGWPKKTAAREVGLNPNSTQSILEKSDEYWDVEYIGDEEWRRRRTVVQNGERELSEIEA